MNLGWLPGFAGLRWLRVHLITLGLLGQAVFGMLPGLADASAPSRHGSARRGAAILPAWIAFNIGVAALLVGVPRVQPAICGRVHTPGGVHLAAAYAWLPVSILAVPLLLLGGDRAAVAAALEQYAPQFLIYIWILQAGTAVVPYLIARTIDPASSPVLGGTWLSVAALQAGGVAFVIGIAWPAFRGSWHALAYVLWAIALVPIGRNLWSQPRGGSAPVPLGRVREAASSWMTGSPCQEPSSSSSRALLNPTTASPSMTVTGVAEKPIWVSSSRAWSSSATSLSTNTMPFWRRNSFTRPQNSQPGCE